MSNWPAPASQPPDRGPRMRRLPPTVAVVSGQAPFLDHVLSIIALAEHAYLQPWRDAEEVRLDPEQVVKEAATNDAYVLCIGSDVSTDFALELATFADAHPSQMSVVMVGSPTAALWRDALRSGVRDLVDVKAVNAELAPAVRRGIDRVERLRELRIPSAVPIGPAKGRIIVVLSPKGGSGKTMVASNLGATLGRASGESVVIVDLDVQFGDCASAFGLTPEHSIAQLSDISKIDPTALKAHLTLHEPSGVFVLCGSSAPEEGEAISDDHVFRILELLANDFAYVVVDTCAGLDERALAALELATDLVLVSSLDVSSIRSLGNAQQSLGRLNLRATNRYFVLNRADSKVGIEIGDVQSVLGMQTDAAIPSSRSVPLSMNQGRLIAIDEPSSNVAREIGRLTSAIAAAGASDSAEPDQKSRFRRKKK
jgi:pilus assembly protein CpaE